MKGNAIITGASSGIGRELALELVRRGWRVALLARRGDLLEELAAEIRGRGGEALVFPLDVVDAAAMSEAVTRSIAAWGSIDLAIANAGQGFPTAAARLDLEAARGIMRTNFEGMLNLMGAVLPAMLARGSGRLVGIASLAGFRGLPGSSVYSASKAAMRAWLEASRVELAHRGIGVTTINPGFIRTAMTEKNRFRMPFLMDVDVAARRIADAIEQGKKELSFPLPMALFMRLARILPNAVWDRVSLPYAKAKSKSSASP